jgi:formylglycine-generating enzyme required for sulfatase activity
VAWYVSNSSSHKFDVKQKAANGYGLYDMFGNVWEWTEDWYHSDYNGAPATGYPGWTSPADTVRVLRGAGFLSLESYLSSSFRGVGDPGGGSEIGFRCVRQH